MRAFGLGRARGSYSPMSATYKGLGFGIWGWVLHAVLALLEASARLKGQEEQFERILNEARECR